MPLPGQGAVPTGALYTELTAATRRAFVPRLFVQMYFATPTLFYLMGQSQKAAGGLSQITIPIQGNSMVQGQFTGYAGGFNSPVITPGVQNAQFPLCYWVVPVPLPFGETVIQATDREISLLKARMNDVWSVTVQNMGGLLYSLNTANSLLPNSFIDAFDNGNNANIYGGIARTGAGATATWQSNYISGAVTPGSSGYTRATMANNVIQVTQLAGGEVPTFGVMNPGDFATLNKDTISSENVFYSPGQMFDHATGIRSAFPNISIAGCPIYADYFCPKGQMFFVNMKYSNLYMSEDAAFDFSGFYSLVPLGQIGQQGVVVLGYNFVSAKPASGAQYYGFTGSQF